MLFNNILTLDSPVFFGGGERLFSGISKDVNVKIKEAFGSKEVTHVTFELEN
jgi:hypothetical protein